MVSPSKLHERRSHYRNSLKTKSSFALKHYQQTNIYVELTTTTPILYIQTRILECGGFYGNLSAPPSSKYNDDRDRRRKWFTKYRTFNAFTGCAGADCYLRSSALRYLYSGIIILLVSVFLCFVKAACNVQ